MMRLTIVATGGNSLIDPSLPPSVDNQYAVTRRAMAPVAKLLARGEPLILTHGNGPQVGFMALRSELSRAEVHEVPLDSLVADTQGALGYMIQKALREELRSLGVAREIITVVTEVEVDPHDQAFEEPTKPIGRFYTKSESAQAQVERGWIMRDDAHRGYRRVVPSPAPVRVLQQRTIQRLAQEGVVVICCGGGGIPVALNAQGETRGIEGVIDKDRASALLAVRLGADRLIITTGVDRVYRDFLTDNPTPITHITVSELHTLLDADQFPKGSMRPKVKAVCRFLEEGGQIAHICAVDAILDAIDGDAGTRITP